MIQTEMLQLTKQCNDWRETLRCHRDELQKMQTALQQAVNNPLSKDEQTELEHLQNQLYIQLINVHDLKKAVKLHDRKLSYQGSGSNDFQFSDNVSAYHENLHNKYHTLELSINELRTDLHLFVQAIH